MKQTIRKNITELPYSLHDCIVNQMTLDDNRLTLHFPKGFYNPRTEENDRVKGYIQISYIDNDFSFVYILSKSGFLGKFKGEKVSLEEFVTRNPNVEFEITDETYGYNQTVFSGYLYEKHKVTECTMAIYHLEDMEYCTEE